MAIAPEKLPGPQHGEQGGPDAFSGLRYGVPEGFGDPPDLAPTPALPGDLYPRGEEYDRLLTWCQTAFNAAVSHQEQFAQRWRRYYKLYRSFVERQPGSWNSAVFIPVCFWIVETVTPRLVAQLPRFLALPVTQDDVENSKVMTQALQWASQNSGLFEQLVAAFKSSLKYGTGILKTFHRTDIRKGTRMEPLEVPLMRSVQVPVVDEQGRPHTDHLGNPIVETIDTEVGRQSFGTRPVPFQYTAYDGPAAECIDIFNFFVAPEAHDVQSARYVAHRTYKQMSYVKRRIAEGIYHWPDNMGPDEIADTRDDPALERLSGIGLGSGSNPDPTSKPVELVEFWTDDGRVITMVNRKAILRVQENPFNHSEKPFVRIVDYYQEHEFWGVGEIEPVEGLQDAQNALTNSRIDNIRLLLNRMFYVNPAAVVDMADFVSRPGGLVRGKGDYRPEEAFSAIEMGDVTSSVFHETELLERTTEKVSGVSGIQMGIESSSLNNTATGLALQTEQGASRFGMKSRLIELMGLAPLGRQFASNLQQFLSAPMQVRLGFVDPATGEPAFETFTPESIQGGFDITIEAESMQQSKTMEVEQKQNLLGLIAQFAPQGVNAALMEVLDAMGIKDKEKFIHGDPNDPMSQMMMQAQMAQMEQAMAPPQNGPPGMEGMPPPDEMMPPAGPEAYANPAAGTPGDRQAQMMMEGLSGMQNQAAAL